MSVDASQRGLPRPILQGLPAPYSGEDKRHGLPDFDRLRECVVEDVCAVCGELVDDDIFYVAAYAENTALLMDQGVILHERCARLSLAHCPHMRHGFSMVFWVRRSEVRNGPERSYRDITPEARADAPNRRLMLKSTAERPELDQPWRPANEDWPDPPMGDDDDATSGAIVAHKSSSHGSELPIG